MTVKMKFVGGPMDALELDIDGLHEVKAFFPAGERRVIVYRRDPMICERCYIYDHDLTLGLTRKYDEAFAMFNHRDPANLISADQLKPKADPNPVKGYLEPGTWSPDSDKDSPFAD